MLTSHKVSVSGEARVQYLYYTL